MGPETLLHQESIFTLTEEVQRSAVFVICKVQSFILATVFITGSSLWVIGCPVYKKVESIPFFISKSQWRICSWLTAYDIWRMLFLFPLSRRSFQVNSTMAIKRFDTTRIVKFFTDLCCLLQCTPLLSFCFLFLLWSSLFLFRVWEFRGRVE